MIEIVSVKLMQETADKIRREGRTIGVVPTMGYLHEGHLSLIRLSKQNTDVTVTTVFVNPSQFAPGEDYKRYPRDLEHDRKMADSAGSDYIFIPSVEEMYPAGYSTYIEVEGLTAKLEGKSRPTHFRGVATIVAKLFNTIKPHAAVFGQKDAQQAAVIKRMVHDLNMDVRVIVAPIVRETDGLAMSSRNVYLSPEERKQSAAIHRALKRGEEMIRGGERNCARVIAELTADLGKQPLIRIEYVSINDAETLEECYIISEKRSVLISVALFVGSTRLIDNITVTT